MDKKGYEEFTGGVNVGKLLDEERVIYNLPSVLAYAIETGMNSFSKQHGNANILKYVITNGGKEKILQTLDDGEGMNREMFKEYHKCYSDTSELTIGDINFRGMGNKSLLKKVRLINTETKQDGKHYRSEWWYDANIENTRVKLFDYVADAKVLTPSGTCVETIIVNKEEMAILTEESLTKAIQRHMIGVLLGEYGEKEIWVNDKRIYAPYSHPKTYKNHRIRTFNKIGMWKGKKYSPKAMFYYSPEPLPEEECGIWIIVGKKTICRQDDWFRQFPKENENQIGGYIIADYLVDAVNSGKDGFKKSKKFKEFYTVASEEWGKFLKTIYIESEEPVIGKETEKIINKVAKEITKKLPKWEEIEIALMKKRHGGEKAVVPPNLPKIKCPVCGSKNKKEYAEDTTKWICLDCNNIYDKRWTKKNKTQKQNALHFVYEEKPARMLKYKPSWYDSSSKAITINVTLSTWKYAEDAGGKTLEFYCKSIALDALIEYGTDVEDKAELFYRYFGDFNE